MNRPFISLLHATHKSEVPPHQLRDEWIRKASNPVWIEYCLAYDKDDISVSNLEIRKFREKRIKFIVNQSPYGVTSVANWNLAATLSKGQLLLPIADDLVPEYDWDIDIMNLLKVSEINPLVHLALWKLSDFKCSQFTEDGLLPRHPLVTRALYATKANIFTPQLQGRGCDDTWLFDALKGKYLFDGRIVKFHHAVGPILSSSGEVLCSCFGKKRMSNLAARSSSESQRLQQITSKIAKLYLKRLSRIFYHIQLPCLASPIYSKRVTKVLSNGRIIKKSFVQQLYWRVHLFLR